MVFETGSNHYSFLKLELVDIPTLQALFEKCEDYARLVEGEEVSPTAAEEIFHSYPPGRSLEDKLLWGLFDQKNELVGLLEGFAHYPEEGTWWIGLLILAPEIRGQGVGRRLVDGFSEHVRSQNSQAIMLGVVEDNREAFAFWQRMGFILEYTRKPKQFGKKVQRVHVMRREVMVDADERRWEIFNW